MFNEYDAFVINGFIIALIGILLNKFFDGFVVVYRCQKQVDSLRALAQSFRSMFLQIGELYQSDIQWTEELDRADSLIQESATVSRYNIYALYDISNRSTCLISEISNKMKVVQLVASAVGPRGWKQWQRDPPSEPEPETWHTPLLTPLPPSTPGSSTLGSLAGSSFPTIKGDPPKDFYSPLPLPPKDFYSPLPPSTLGSLTSSSPPRFSEDLSNGYSSVIYTEDSHSPMILHLHLHSPSLPQKPKEQEREEEKPRSGGAKEGGKNKEEEEKKGGNKFEKREKENNGEKEHKGGGKKALHEKKSSKGKKKESRQEVEEEERIAPLPHEEEEKAPCEGKNIEESASGEEKLLSSSEEEPLQSARPPTSSPPPSEVLSSSSSGLPSHGGDSTFSTPRPINLHMHFHSPSLPEKPKEQEQEEEKLLSSSEE